MRILCIPVFTAVLLGLGAGASAATDGKTSAAPDPVAKACRAGVRKHCASRKDAAGRLECLQGARDDLAPACYWAVFGADADVDPDWRVVCRPWIQKRCDASGSPVRVMACLRKHHRDLDSRCLFLLYGECDPDTWKPGYHCGDDQ
jgi:hypothetical protein